ncbi:hypothetical protein V1507DRAFT_450963 [Lipomyces tetrasporus]
MPKKRFSSSQKDHQNGRGATNGYGKPSGRRNGKQQGGAKKNHGTDRWSEERGQRRAFSMRDEALYTMRHHNPVGEDANYSPTTRSAVTFVQSARLPGYDIAAKEGQRMRQLESPHSEGENSSADELYNELLDEEDELVESTRHLSVLAKADNAIELDSRSDKSNHAAEGVTEENDVENMPDDMLFMADDVKQIVDVPFNDEIVFAPRHIRLSASGVRLPARPLDLTISAPIVPKIVDESLHIEVADKITLTQKASVAATSSKKQKKKKTNKRKAPKASFPYQALIDDDDGDPLDDYIQNLYDDEILDEFLEEVNPADGIVEKDENVTNMGEDGMDGMDGMGMVQQEYVVNVSDTNLSHESSLEHREIQIETVDGEDGNRDDNNDGDEDEAGDEDEDDDEDDDEEREDDEDGDFGMGQDDYDYGDDDDILESERRFAEAEFMDITTSKKMKRMPQFDISDEELEHQLKSQWLKDKAAKKEKKKEREALRREGLLGKKARKGTRDLNAKYSRGMRVSDIKSEIETFLRNDGQTTLSLPPMDKNSRKAVHVLAAAYNLSSKSIGGGTQRFTILFKNSRSYLEADFGTLSIVEDRYYLPRLDKKASKIPVTKDYSRRGTGSFRHRDGDVVGSNAPEIDSENRGRQLLEKMGWVSGSGLGVAGNVGMSLPIMAKVKTSKAGLG